MAYTAGTYAAPAQTIIVEVVGDLPATNAVPAGTIARVAEDGAVYMYQPDVQNSNAVEAHMITAGATTIGSATANTDFVGGALFEIERDAATPHNIADGEFFVVMTGNLGADKSVVLPTAASATGRTVVVKLGGTAGGFAVNVTVSGGGNIDNAATYAISTNYGVGRFISDGTEWWSF